MPGRVLVAYATRTGSTAEVADAGGRGRGDAGLDADVRAVASAGAVDGCNGAVLGSGIRNASSLPEMTDFLAAYGARLTTMPLAAPAVAEVVPLSEVRRAHQRVEAGDVQGKLVMRVSEQ